MKLMNLIFPPKCSFCGKTLAPNTKAPYVCKSCRENLPHLPIRFCPNCHKIMDVAANLPYCPYCAGNKYPFEYLISPFSYEKIAKDGVANLKFSNAPSVAQTFAYNIFKRVDENNLLPEIGYIVPAPISKERMDERGYNQSLIIAVKLSEYLGIPIKDVLIKVKDTVPQSSLNHHDRLSNLNNAIDIKEKIDKNVLFVDDVYTTGTTTAHCCKLLKRAGAKKVFVACATITPLSTDFIEA